MDLFSLAMWFVIAILVVAIVWVIVDYFASYLPAPLPIVIKLGFILIVLLFLFRKFGGAL